MTLQQYRTKHGLTLEELAGRVGVTKQGLALIESGNGCRLKTAKAIVDATQGEVGYEDLLVDPANPGGATEEPKAEPSAE